MDEVGRGCLAGPVVAAAVLLPPEISTSKDPWLKQVTDSKELEPEEREDLAPRIRAWAAGFAVAQCSAQEIDQHNILQASLIAMVRAVSALPRVPGHVLVDGNMIPKGLTVPATAIIQGDLKCLSVACGSILAKVWRDAHLTELEARHPGYGFASNKGYPTPVHFQALDTLGPCVEHRRSFGPVARSLNPTLGDVFDATLPADPVRS
ncbi:MAG TPA: ribonuclease HII [Bdellovibrionota bacterium]|nr:ribonuclease HII [Bdellovibrionota bacterium]